MSQTLWQTPDVTRKERFCIVLLLGAVVFAYGNALWNGFAQDDLQLYIVHNAQVTEPSLRALFTPQMAAKVFRPVTIGTFALDWKAGGGRPFAFHVVNLLLHAAVTLLFYVLLLALLQSSVHANEVACAAALLFAVHPIHTEAVTSIVGRAELLAAGFLLAAWILHLKDRAIPALICFVLALLSKESAVVFLPLTLIGDYARSRWKPKLRYMGIAGVSLLYLCVLWKVRGGLASAGIRLLDNPLASLPAGPRILNALRVAWKYVGLQIYPATLSCDYSFNEIPLYRDWHHTLPAAIGAVAVFSGWLWAVWRRQHALALAGGVYLAGFAVTANIVMPIGTIMGERLAYLPSAGFCLLIALGWGWLRERQQVLALGVLAVLVAVLGARTVARNRDWKDNLTLYSAAVRAVPGSAKMHQALGVEYMQAGQLDLASKELQAALQINPAYAEAREAYGLLEDWKGNYQTAGEMLESAFYMVGRNHPNYDDMAVNLAVVYMETNHMDGALDILNHEIADSPRFARAWAIRGMVHHKRGEVSAARADGETALRLDPASRPARELMHLLNPPAQPISAQ
jgi:Tfp pilus assembly protein PilF